MKEMVEEEELTLRVAYSDRQRKALDAATPVVDLVDGRGGIGI